MTTPTTGNYNEVLFPGTVDSPKIESRAVAPVMIVEWEPVTNKCVINFQCQRYLLLDGVWTKAMGNDDKMPNFQIKVSDDFAKCWGYTGSIDPVTAVALDRISAAGMMEIIKAAFEQKYDEEFNRRTNLPPPVSTPTLPPVAPVNETPPPEEEF